MADPMMILGNGQRGLREYLNQRTRVFGDLLAECSNLTHILCRPICCLAIPLQALTEILLKLNRMGFHDTARCLASQAGKIILCLLVWARGVPFSVLNTRS